MDSRCWCYPIFPSFKGEVHYDGQVITIPFTSKAHLTLELVLEISHRGDDLLMTGFTFDEV